MSQSNHASKKQQREERKKTYTRDVHRHWAIRELMWRDPLGAQLTQLLVQLYKGYKEDTTVPALEKHGLFHDKVIPFVKQLYGEQPEGDARSSLEAELASCCDALCQKYHIAALHITRETLLEEVKAEMVRELLDTIHGTSPLTLDAKQIAGLQEQFAQAFGMEAAHCWSPREGWKTLGYTRNWIPANTPKLIIEPDRAYLVLLAEQAPPLGEPPTLTITLDLSQVTTNDLERLTWEFKAIVKQALQSLPTSPVSDPQAVETALSYTVHGQQSTQSPTTRPTLTVVLDCSRVNQRYLQRLEQKFKALLHEARAHVPEERFEHKLFRWEEFIRDVRRYDWHMHEGMSFRDIAFQERLIEENARQHGETLEEPWALPTPFISRQDTIPIREEDGVEQGIKKIYQAIHRQPYPTAGIEPDTEALGKFQYRCRYHPLNDCPEDCAYASQWMKSIRKFLPTDYRGGSREVPVSNTLLDARPRAKVLQDMYGEEYGEVRQDENGDEVMVDDQTSALLLEAFEDYAHLGWFTGEAVGDDHGASVEDMDYLAAYEWEDEGYLEYPEELQ